VLTTPDLRRAADALDAIIARLGDRDTTAVLTGMKGLRLERLDQKLLWRLEADRSFYDLEMTDEEAAGTFLLSLREAVGDALRQRCWLVGVNSS